MVTSRAWATLLLVSACFLLGCIRSLDEERSAVGELERDCVIPVPQDVTELGPPVSLEYPNGSLWIWERVELAGGAVVENPSAFVASVDEACSRGPALARGDGGNPTPLLSLTEEERAAHAARTDGRLPALRATGGFVHEGTGYLFYEHVLVGPGFFDIEVLGTGLCLLPPDATTCERLAPSGDTILFPASARSINQGGLVAGDRGILYGCRRVASFTTVCTVTGVPLDRVAEPSAYQVWNELDGWVDDPLDAAVIAEEAGPLTVSAYEGGFLGTTLDLFESRVYVRRAARPTDELERRVATFELVASDSLFPGGGREHAGLRRAERQIHVSYFTRDENEGGLHLATFRFFGEFGGHYQ